MPPRCTVCDRKDIDQINETLLEGNESVRNIAKRYGVHPSSMHRHRQKCLIETATREIAKRDNGDPIKLIHDLQRDAKAVDVFRRMSDRLGDLMSKAESLHDQLEMELRDPDGKLDRQIAQLILNAVHAQDRVIGRYVDMAGELREQERHQWARRELEYRAVQDALARMVQLFPDAAAWLDEQLGDVDS